MNHYQNSKQTSFKLIVKEAKNYPETVSLIPRFAAGVSRLEVISADIEIISIQQAKNITGVKGDKDTLVDKLSDFTVDVSGAIHSYAIAKGDKTLLAKVNFKESAIARMSQADLSKAIAITIEEADKISTQDLAHEGITADEMTEFKSVYNQFKSMSTNTREAIIDRSGYTKQLSLLFAEASEIKKNTLDRLASQFQRKAPEFYQKYKAAATVIYKRSSKTHVAEPVKQPE
jgi:hypothetical protein